MFGSPDPAFGSSGASIANSFTYVNSFNDSLDSIKEADFLVLTLVIISLNDMKLFFGFYGFRFGHFASIFFLTTENP